MPFGFGNAGTFTSSSGGDIGGGKHATRFRGPLILGIQGDMGSTQSTFSIQPPHVVNISTGKADMLISVVSSFANAAAVTSSSNNVSTASPAGLVYISMSTGAGNLIAAGSTANAPTGLPGGANGVALCWDAVNHTLAVYEPQSSAWLWPHQAASSNVALGGTIVWSASSS